MKFEFDDSDLRRLAGPIVSETLERLEATRAKVNGQLAFNEAEAAALIGLQRHQLRDARLRGEVRGSKVGKRILYSRCELLKLLERNQVP